MLGDLHLLDHLSERGAVPGAVLAHHSDLLRALGLVVNKGKQRIRITFWSTKIPSNHLPLLLEVLERNSGVKPGQSLKRRRTRQKRWRSKERARREENRASQRESSGSFRPRVRRAVRR